MKGVRGDWFEIVASVTPGRDAEALDHLLGTETLLLAEP